MNCLECQSAFICKLNTACWCQKLPKLLVPYAESCLCYDCLISKLASQINQTKEVVDPVISSQIKDLGEPIKLTKDIDFKIEIINGEDKYVFSKWYLLRRGYCCDNNCRNCPYLKLN